METTSVDECCEKLKKFLHFNYNPEEKVLENVDEKMLTYNEADKYEIINVIEKKIVSDQFYPALTSDGGDLRSLEYINKCNQTHVYPLEDDDRLYFTIALRDLFMCCVLQEFADEKFNSIVRDIRIETTPKEISFLDDCLPISYFPSRSFQVVRYVDKDLLVNDPKYCIHSGKKVVFMRKYDLTYYNFENIISLDDDYLKCLKRKSKNFFNHRFFRVKDDTVVFKLNKLLGKVLLKLDLQKYYIKPFNDDQRGGLRFIFNSQYLAKILTDALKWVFVTSEVNFVKVNNVFRYNKFQQKDDIFKSHYDVAYTDKENREYSLYTLVIYLKSDKDKVCLKIDDEEYKFDDFECIIFNQSKVHEGYTFDGKKIFIRSDLIFHIEDDKMCNIRDDYNELAKLFDQACYLSLKSVFQPSLKQYSSDLFHQFNTFKYKNVQLTKKIDHYFSIASENKINPTYFVTNGYNYYFPYCKNISVKQYVTMILHDFFSSRYVNEIENMVDVKDELERHLFRCNCNSNDFKVTKIEKDDQIDYYFGDNSNENCSQQMKFPPLSVEPYKGIFCTACYDDDFDPRIDPEAVQDADYGVGYGTKCVEDSNPEKYHAGVAGFKLNNIEVVGNRIYFFTDRRVHFAACLTGYSCWGGRFVDTTTYPRLKNNVFTDFIIENNVITFTFDFFKNNVTFDYNKEDECRVIFDVSAFSDRYDYRNRSWDET